MIMVQDVLEMLLCLWQKVLFLKNVISKCPFFQVLKLEMTQAFVKNLLCVSTYLSFHEGNYSYYLHEKTDV